MTLTDVFYSALAAATWLLAAFAFREDVAHLSPDGVYYLLAGEGKRVPLPYCLRPLCPLMCRNNARLWSFLSYAAIAVLGALTFWYLRLHNAGSMQAMSGALVAATLVPLVRLTVMLPILVDVPSLCWMLSAVIAFESGYTTLAYVNLFFGTLSNEKTPIYAAIMLWSAEPLYFCAITAALYFRKTEPKPEELFLSSPFRFALAEHGQYFKTPRLFAERFLAHFGATLAAAFTMNYRLTTSLVVGLCASLRSTDFARVIVWSFPLLILCTLQAVPAVLLPALPLVSLLITSKAKGC